MNYIEYEDGEVYNLEHLKPFDLDLAKQGHPLATDDGYSVRLFRQRDKEGTEYAMDIFQQGVWCHERVRAGRLALSLRLAPLEK